MGGPCDGGCPGEGSDGEGLNPGTGGPTIGPDDAKGIALVGAEGGDGLTSEPSGLAPATGPDDKKGLIVGGGAATNGLTAGRPGTFGRPGFPLAIQITPCFFPQFLPPFHKLRSYEIT